MIKKTAIVYRYGRLAVLVFTMGLVFAMQPMRALAVTGLALVWTPSTSSNVAGYHVYYGGMSGVYTNRISTVNATNAVISGLVEGATYYFAAAAYDSAGLESPLSKRGLLGGRSGAVDAVDPRRRAVDAEDDGGFRHPARH
jgi:Fibronectin type III domain